MRREARAKASGDRFYRTRSVRDEAKAARGDQPGFFARPDRNGFRAAAGEGLRRAFGRVAGFRCRKAAGRLRDAGSAGRGQMGSDETFSSGLRPARFAAFDSSSFSGRSQRRMPARLRARHAALRRGGVTAGCAAPKSRKTNWNLLRPDGWACMKPASFGSLALFEPAKSASKTGPQTKKAACAV